MTNYIDRRFIMILKHFYAVFYNMLISIKHCKELSQSFNLELGLSGTGILLIRSK